MPKLEINATQPWLIAPNGNVAEITARADHFLANGSMSSKQSGKGDIRRALIKADLVDCMVPLPGQLFTAMEEFNVALAA